MKNDESRPQKGSICLRSHQVDSDDRNVCSTLRLFNPSRTRSYGRTRECVDLPAPVRMLQLACPLRADPVEESFDAVARAIEVRTKADWIAAVAFRRDVGPCSPLHGKLSDPVGVVATVGKQH